MTNDPSKPPPKKPLWVVVCCKCKSRSAVNDILWQCECRKKLDCYVQHDTYEKELLDLMDANGEST